MSFVVDNRSLFKFPNQEDINYIVNELDEVGILDYICNYTSNFKNFCPCVRIIRCNHIPLLKKLRSSYFSNNINIRKPAL